MTRTAWLAAGLLVAALTGPSLASPCATDIAALEGKVKDQATDTISASTGGQAAAGAREGQGATAQSGNASTQAAPARQAAEAGKGADKATQARVALDEARTADKAGDAKACSDAVARARQNIDAAP